MEQANKQKLINFFAFVGLVALIFAFDIYMYKAQNAKKLKNLNNSRESIFSARQDFRGTSSDISGVVVEERLDDQIEPDKIPSSIPSSEQSQSMTQDLPLKEYVVINSDDQKKLGITFEYPAKMFVINPTDNGILLSSQYSFISNPSGLEGKQMIHNFSISFQTYQKNILSAIKDDMPYVFDALFPKNSESSFADSPGYAKKIKIQNFPGYEINEGAEGINLKHVYLQISNSKTLVIKFRFIGDMLNPRISQTQQEEIFTKILESIK